MITNYSRFNLGICFYLLGQIQYSVDIFIAAHINMLHSCNGSNHVTLYDCSTIYLQDGHPLLYNLLIFVNMALKICFCYKYVQFPCLLIFFEDTFTIQEF